jgi:1-acyl-sn-glycerol-3-phosphate acyltransferase
MPVDAKTGGVASLVATVVGNVYLVVGTLVLTLATLLTGWIPLPGGSRLFYFWARLWSRLLLLTSGVRVTAEHLAALDPRRAYVFLSNHQSLYDIPVLLATLPLPARFMAKRELFRIPLFGWALHYGGFIPVDRGAGRSARESFRAATARLAQGRSVLLFPEETRSRDGRLLPFKRGGFLLAHKAGLPVVPVGVRGTLGVRRRDSYRIRPGRVLVRYGEPIEPIPGRRGVDELVERTQAAIAELAGIEAPPIGAERVEALLQPDGMVSGAAEATSSRADGARIGGATDSADPEIPASEPESR